MKSRSQIDRYARTARPAVAGLGIYSLACAVLMAHPGHVHPGEEDEFDAFTHGIVHPFTGLDHLLLAIAAGWLVVSLARGKAWIPFASFLAALAAGAVVGRGFQAGSGLEIALSFTVIAAGLAIAFRKSPGPGVFACAIGMAGFIHGFAHGAEASPDVPFGIHTVGLVMGTATLLVMGGLLEKASRFVRKPLLPELAGGALIAIGSVALVQAI